MAFNLNGKKFGKLRVVEKAPRELWGSKSHSYWICVCECGTQKIVRGSHLKSGQILSCGCSRIKHIFIVGEKEPLCECCHKPMRWHKDSNRTSGGSWRCRTKARESQRKWVKNNHERKLNSQRKWAKNNPEKMRESKRKYRDNPKVHLKEIQYMTLYRSKKRLEALEKRAERLYA